ncbi:hypothetical protein F1D05_13945 [Kribbella qitaiheensis]|uniref:Uncharacterized protein n=1 Tax=Kribbella qitaiheensis TaxID=1544730 RepID=A0A7G6WXU0_9ACTN|nr:hypothetical protein [Kribbella qitaiheensis]QNE18805.1 hypothetical protein F1D05_13945 [Kribbella qitaiheensis]
MDGRTELRLQLTPQELAGIAALTAGVSGVNESEVSPEDAVVAAIEFALTRLIDDYEVPDASARDQVRIARDQLRAGWVRGNASL